jgi:hypothetical protein
MTRTAAARSEAKMAVASSGTATTDATTSASTRHSTSTAR